MSDVIFTCRIEKEPSFTYKIYFNDRLAGTVSGPERSAYRLLHDLAFEEYVNITMSLREKDKEFRDVQHIK
jgi:hypothetical protein